MRRNETKSEGIRHQEKKEDFAPFRPRFQAVSPLAIRGFLTLVRPLEQTRPLRAFRQFPQKTRQLIYVSLL